MTDLPIILGSASPWRQALLKSAGISFTVMHPNIDEKAIRLDDPATLVMAIADAKNIALKQKISEDVILITSDQVVVCNDTIYKKPVNAAEARAFLTSYNKHPAETFTAVIIENTKTLLRETIVDRASIFFHIMPDEVIEAIIEKGDIFACAGGFQVEGDLSSQYVKHVDGDLNSVKGLPVSRVLRAISELHSQC